MFDVKNTNFEILVSADVMIDIDKMFIDLYATPYSKDFDDAFKRGLVESLKTLKTEQEHKRFALDKAKKTLPMGITIDDVGYSDAQKYKLNKLFAKITQLNS